MTTMTPTTANKIIALLKNPFHMTNRQQDRLLKYITEYDLKEENKGKHTLFVSPNGFIYLNDIDTYLVNNIRCLEKMIHKPNITEEAKYFYVNCFDALRMLLLRKNNRAYTLLID